MASGRSIYARFRSSWASQIRASRSYAELLKLDPKIAQWMINHFDGVLRTGDLIGVALYQHQAIEKGVIQWATLNGRLSDLPQGLADIQVRSLRRLKPQTKGQAWSFFKDKVTMKQSEFLKRSDLWHDKAFTIAKLENENVTKAIKAEIEQALEGKVSLEDFKKDTPGIFKRAGIAPISNSHISTVYLTNIHSAVALARENEFNNDTPGLRTFYPAMEYVTAGDDNVREEHAALNGFIYGRDHPFWDMYTPPNGYNCRCDKIAVSLPEIQERGIKFKTDVPKGTKLPDKDFQGKPGMSAKERAALNKVTERPVAQP